MPYCSDQPTFFSEESSEPKDLKLLYGDDLCDGLNIDDVLLAFEADDKIFGCSQGQSRHQFEDVGNNDRALIEKNLSVVESNGPIPKTYQWT
ncbi:hypothetical protein Ddye_023479 [Dipteronia dyeriana]|uniref:Uncharacterized protein n=1 Tax=Dipteronia dyeriana TaxID=168575 RepID=A0AAD9WSP3_9ROSI|nr:hypothetical protein Ddye_023479 [Dipteronia dyeriana]